MSLFTINDDGTDLNEITNDNGTTAGLRMTITGQVLVSVEMGFCGTEQKFVRTAEQVIDSLMERRV